MKCSLCGHEFAQTEAHQACQKCWLARFCALVRCPNCGFEMPADDKLAERLETYHQKAGHAGRAGQSVLVGAPAAPSHTSTKDVAIVTSHTTTMNSNGALTKLGGWLARTLGVKPAGGACAAGQDHKMACACAAEAAAVEHAHPLTALMPGRRAVIARLDTSQREGLRQLLSLGLLPHTEITLLRRYPTLVVQLGHSQFAIDRELASLVFVINRGQT